VVRRLLLLFRGEAAVRILIAEDDRKIASFIQQGLQEEGHAADIFYDGTNAGHQALSFDYDLIILDLMLPGRLGLDVLRDIRSQKPRLPVLVLTAKGSIDETVHGLDSGADDYMAKPFAFVELSARIRALLRRGALADTRLHVGELELDTATRQVNRAGRRIDLTAKEYALLEFLMRHAHRPVTRTMIIEHVWDIHFDSISNVVDVHINSLRNKIDKGCDLALLRTIRGVGYMISDR
jgi:two-component system copper resistance phosphate regulon response regulator CusR